MIDYKALKPAEFTYRGTWIYNWFSNMEPSVLHIDGWVYRSVEAYYQSQKTTDPVKRNQISLMTSSQAKQAGRKITIRDDWEEIKYDVMKKGLRVKFSRSPWKQALLGTDDEMIIEWNNWQDTVWGVDVFTCKGQNLLGKALMEIREEIKLM